MITFQFGWSSYAANLLLSLCLWFSVNVLTFNKCTRYFQIFGSDLTWCLFIKKVISKSLITIDQFPFFGKIFEKLLFNSITNFLEDNNVLSSNHSGFRPNYTSESQLLSAVHDIYSSFDCHPSLEVRGIFLDISRAFDRVWHERLLYKIQSIGISGTPLKFIESFLSGRCQHVLLNVQASSWSPILAGVSQESVLDRSSF